MELNRQTRIYFFAFGSTDHASLAGKPITGDGANITCQISLDGAAFQALTDTTATELGNGYYVFTLEAAENNVTDLLAVATSSTAEVELVNVNTHYPSPHYDATSVLTAISNAVLSLTAEHDATQGDLASILSSVGTLLTNLSAVLADTNEMQSSLVDGGRLDLIFDAIKTKTDQLNFRKPGEVNANVTSTNDATQYGDGTELNPWRGTP